MDGREVLLGFAADKANFPGGDLRAQGDLGQETGLQFLLNEFSDDTGDPEADLGEFDEHVHGTDFQERVQFDPVFFQGGVDVLAGDVRVVGQHEDGVGLQGFCQTAAAFAYLKVFQVGMGADEGVLDALERLVVTVEFSGGAPDQAEVDLAVFQQGHGLIGRLTVDGHFYVRVLLDELLQIGAQDVPAQGGADADAQLGDPQGVSAL